MFTITIAREFGSGGLKIADRVAGRLGIPCLDREIVRFAAEQASISERAAENLDETRPSLAAHMLELIGRYGGHESYSELGTFSSMSVPPPSQLPVDSEAFREAVEKAVRSVAEQRSAVIVGRAGQAILRHCPNTLHVLIVADFGDRVERIVQREALSRGAAEKRVGEVEARRSAYLKRYYKIDWRDSRLYDLVLNSSLLGVESCASIIVEAVAQKGWASANAVSAQNGAMFEGLCSLAP